MKCLACTYPTLSPKHLLAVGHPTSLGSVVLAFIRLNRKSEHQLSIFILAMNVHNPDLTFATCGITAPNITTTERHSTHTVVNVLRCSFRGISCADIDCCGNVFTYGDPSKYYE